MRPQCTLLKIVAYYDKLHVSGARIPSPVPTFMAFFNKKDR